MVADEPVVRLGRNSASDSLGIAGGGGGGIHCRIPHTALDVGGDRWFPELRQLLRVCNGTSGMHEYRIWKQARGSPLHRE